MFSGINLDYFVLDLCKRIKCMLKIFFSGKLMPSFSKLIVYKPVCLAAYFLT